MERITGSTTQRLFNEQEMPSALKYRLGGKSVDVRGGKEAQARQVSSEHLLKHVMTVGL